ncbi:T9SS type A sorting domain-containing protein [Mariniflexile sp. HNIBRBA6329]|uniref:T9SS type A sorting domain-containing protein n=1 Tax=Mariniflexile sp. HNIBRBA6329 TaxID=3373088 RepID=UPI0037476D9B
MKKFTLLLMLSVLPFFIEAQVTNTTFNANVDGWIASGNAGATVTWDGIEGSAAAGSLKLISIVSGDRAQSSPNTQLVPSDGNYTLKFKVKGTAGTQIQGSIFQGSLISGNTLTLTGGWDEFSSVFTGLTTVNANIRFVAKTASSVYYIDDVQLIATTITTENSFVLNPDFETGIGGLDNWSLGGPDASLSSTTGNGGGNAAQINFDQDITNQSNNLLENIVFDFGKTVNPSEINAAFDAMSNNTAIEIQVTIRTFDAADGIVETLNGSAEKVAIANTWESFTYNKGITQPFNKILFRIRIKGAAMMGDKVAIDNITSNFTYSTLGINDLEAKDINTMSLYPNPAKTLLNIKSLQNIASISVYDITGKQVLTSNKITNNQLNISNLNNGVYLVRLEDVNRHYEVKKLVVSK